MGSGTLFSEYRTPFASGTLEGSCASSAAMNCSARPCRQVRSQSPLATFGGSAGPCADAGPASNPKVAAASAGSNRRTVRCRLGFIAAPPRTCRSARRPMIHRVGVDPSTASVLPGQWRVDVHFGMHTQILKALVPGGLIQIGLELAARGVEDEVAGIG